jgi:hypothetical protein
MRLPAPQRVKLLTLFNAHANPASAHVESVTNLNEKLRSGKRLANVLRLIFNYSVRRSDK